jgi:hypothetical protein
MLLAPLLREWRGGDPVSRPPARSIAACELGGVWSSYWYNHLIYETNIAEGLNIFRFSWKETAGAVRVGH